MLFNWKNLGVMTLVLLAAAPAMAQGQGGGRGGRGGFGGGFGGFGGGNSAYFLLSNEAVQKDLDLTDDQKSKVGGLVDGYRDAMRGDRQQGGFDGFRELSEEQRRERIATMTKEAEERASKANAEYKPKFNEVLDDVQQQRLQQIFWQSQGSRALRDAELASALKLSPEQTTKIDTLFRDAAPQGGFGRGQGGNRGAGGNNGGDNQDREARMAEFRARQEKLNTEINAVLTEDQKKEKEALLGAPFDVAQLRGGPGGPGGDRGQGGRPGRGGDRPQRSNGN